MQGDCRFEFSGGRGGESDTGVLLGELAELVSNLGIEVAGSEAVKVRNYNPAFVAGEGKCAEIIAAAESARAGVIIFDDELTPAQQRNWEEKSGMEIVTRQEVILDIFASRARTKASPSAAAARASSNSIAAASARESRG